MEQKNFLNFHVLISHSPSCLNRDDMNMQKSAIVGGIRRVRISSQSLKRAMRKSDYYLANLGKPSERTRSLELLKERFTEALKEFEPAIIGEAIDRFAKTAVSEQETDETDDSLTEEDGEGEEKKPASKKIAVAPWVQNEIRILCEIIRDIKQEGLSDSERKKAQEKFDKQKTKKKKLEEVEAELLENKIQKTVTEKVDALRKACGNALDIALSGRMATSGLMTSIDGAMSCAHAITTHAVDADIDWFTAVDDLVPLGSGHLDTQEFSSGVFYRYASLNLKQLQVNLGLIPQMAAPETPESRTRALDISAHLVHLLATVVPSAKQRSFAAFNPADLVMASLSDFPLSAANAFEKPVEAEPAGGFLKPSIKALEDYISRVYTGYGLNDSTAVFSLWDTTLEPKKTTIEELKNWVRNDGRDE
jgi:CRISPR system Cascade subunit CasC